jgi:hypothetical protein
VRILYHRFLCAARAWIAQEDVIGHPSLVDAAVLEKRLDLILEKSIAIRTRRSEIKLRVEAGG